ncbi:mannose-6-phosphate isomerase, class I [Garicola koreensis]|uniref:mannose-6-phosphate isomerase n=1 Tax=Garicola koreensis TaxID=1262554 RepID=A0A7W5TSD4_9MICC|nr:mannose-6-phosphate isomerase, class I [Garicola koreensis]MBB3666478.1 mannose-6-phosphate isomerase [Garicola koreensis]
MFRMINPIQDYAWGSTAAFSELFGWAESTTPQAEIWMGSHAKAPSQLVEGSGELPRLDTHLSEHPQQLGTWQHSGTTLPFLLKILAVATPLSIQVHPSREQARSGFAAEERRGTDLKAPQRNYVDTNHKPELIVALTRFSALCGFRDPRQTLRDLTALQEIVAAQVTSDDDETVQAVQTLSRHLQNGETRAALRASLQDCAEELGHAAKLLAATDLRAHQASLAPQSLDTVERITATFPGDPGLFVALMLNRRDLEPGQALFLPSGSLHAYLGGVGVEIMANSDNVLRGGLTSKHVDVPELLRVAASDVVEQQLLEPDASTPHQHIYHTPAEEFSLRRIDFPDSGLHHEVRDSGPAIAVCTAGTVTAGQMLLSAGESVFIPAGEPTDFSGAAAQLFIATAPSATSAGIPGQHGDPA